MSNKIDLHDISRLINEGKWRRALRLVHERKFETAYAHIAQYWFIRALCESLRGKLSLANSSWKRARRCSDYTAGLEGNFLRDMALYFIRRRNLIRATDLLNRATPYHTDDNHRAVLEMCWGRVDAAAHRWADAIRRYSEAQDIWEATDNPIEQWIMNNRFYLLKARAAIGEDIDELADKVIATDPARSRRMRAQLIKHLGKLGNWVDDMIARSLHM